MAAGLLIPYKWRVSATYEHYRTGLNLQPIDIMTHTSTSEPRLQAEPQAVAPPAEPLALLAEYSSTATTATPANPPPRIEADDRQGYTRHWGINE